MATETIVSGQLGMATPFGDLLGNSTYELQEEIQDYVEMGVDWVRIDVHWSLVQPTEYGGFNWTLVDRVFGALEDAGIEILAVLNNTPDWVDSDLSGSSDQAAYGEFAAAAASHLGDTVDYWEIINEPNKAGIAPEDYTEALKQAYEAIKDVDADDVVISGGTAAVPQTGNGMWGAVDYLEQIYENGGGDYFDAVGYHPYTFPLYPSDSEAWNGWQIMEDGIRDTMIANGDSHKQIWMTELGAPTSDQNVTVTEEEQAFILSEAVELAQQTEWAGPIMWFSYQDSSLDPGFGLLDWNGERKEAYYTFAELANADNDTASSAVSYNSGSETIMGTSSSETLSGTSADDYLSGDAGNDTLLGVDGADTLIGGTGNDALTGGSGADVFRFLVDTGWDRITDFDEDSDVIDISEIDADTTQAGDQDFTFVGSNYLREAGDLGAYYDQSHDRTYLQGDVDGDGAFDFCIQLIGQHTLTEAAFVL